MATLARKVIIDYDNSAKTVWKLLLVAARMALPRRSWRQSAVLGGENRTGA